MVIVDTATIATLRTQGWSWIAIATELGVGEGTGRRAGVIHAKACSPLSSVFSVACQLTATVMDRIIQGRDYSISTSCACQRPPAQEREQLLAYPERSEHGL